ncbi:F0F1 ATP synthase subunit B [Rhizomicrobium electricum]|jgi:F-type H+-transporting ATPase subunit b|uniref:ATP synthase subunit b n=1 Tax=Rhizomicrobium electricum TaxID=480070 RepID=A0ABP3P4T5_9PROT|nr:F0F1 ATP synthase subunit B [Rhizomicrobium electricum]NIJ47349.1 F-type H+-transporting ATPase subunit b [Rhizomicrobium electricum]
MDLFELLKEYEVWVAIGLVVLIVAFLILRVPSTVAKMLDARAAGIAKELEEAKKLREEAAAVLAGYVQKAAQAETEAARIVADAKEEAERFAKETRAQLRQQIERRAQIAREKIEQAETAALDEIRALAADKAAAAAETLITKHLDPSRSAALVEQSIKDFSANTP